MAYLLTEEYVLDQNRDIILLWSKRYGRGLPPEDAFMTACLAFLQAMRTWKKGLSPFHAYADELVRRHLEEARLQRNNHMRVESPFSLDQPIQRHEADSGNAHTIFRNVQGDFVNGVVFRDFIRGLPQPLRTLSHMLIAEYSPQEILEAVPLSHREYDQHLGVLRRRWEAYNAQVTDAA